MILFLISCTGEEPTYGDITSRDEVDVIEEPATEPSEETGVIDTADSAEPIVTTEEMTFRAPLMTCAQIQKRTMTMTRMIPGGLNASGESEAEFFNEIHRLPLSSAEIEYSQTEGLNDCIFSIALPEPNIDELTEVTLMENGEEVSLGVQWAFYYPATFVQEVVDCQTLTLSENNSAKVSCVSSYDTPLTPDPTTEVSNAAVVAGDIYDWGSDVLPVYVQGDIQGAFGDLGFERGWNLAQFAQGEMVLVEPIDRLNQLKQVVFDNRGFLPRYKVNGRGSISAEADFGEEFSVDLLPAHWLISDTTVETGVSMYVQDSEVSWSIEVWGHPNTEQFFGLSVPMDSPYYQQWKSEVDVAVFVPLVFSGVPSMYNSGVPEPGDDIDVTDVRLGAVCKDSSTLAFTFLREAKRPSEVYWYSLMGNNPGWYAQYGTDGDPSTWRMVLENTDISSSYTYMSLAIGNSCQVPEGWQ